MKYFLNINIFLFLLIISNTLCITIKYYNDSNCLQLYKIETVKINTCETIEEQGTILSVITTVCNSTNVLGNVYEDSICQGNIFLHFSHTPKICFNPGAGYYEYIDCELNNMIIQNIHVNSSILLEKNIILYFILLLIMFF